MNNYLVSGGNGFLGSQIVKNLISKGQTPIVLLRENSSISRLIEIVDKCRIVRYGNTSIEEILNREKPNIIIHTACNYGRKGDSISSMIDDNIFYGIKLYEASLKNRAKIFVNIDSTLPKEINAYSLSKHQFKEWLKINSTEIKVLNFRLDHMIGENDDKNKFVHWFIDRCLNDKDLIELTDGSQKRDFIYVKDASDAIIKVIQSDKFYVGFNNFDLGSGELISMKDFVTLLSQCIEKVYPLEIQSRLGWGKLSLRENDFNFPVMDYNWMKNFNWKSNSSLKNILIKIVEEFK